MQTAEALKRKIGSAEDLQSVVKTMKALAAASIRQFERAAQSLEGYSRTIERGIQVVVRSRPEVVSLFEPPKEGRFLAVVFGSDYGMVGQFNDQVVDLAVRSMEADHAPLTDWELWAAGERARSRLEGHDLKASRVFGVPGSVTGVTPRVQEILLEIQDWSARGAVRRVDLFHNRPLSGASYRPATMRLLPVDGEWLKGFAEKEWPTRALPGFTMEPSRLVSALVGQFFFVSIYRCLVESLAAENASRLASMQAAEKNIAERLDELNTEYHRLRQSTITEELMDIVAGFEALTGGGRQY